MVATKRNKWSHNCLYVLLVIVILSITTIAYAQTYAFSVPIEKVDLFWENDGTLSLVYEITLSNAPQADPIDYVDIGMPNSSFNLSNASATIDGQPIFHIAYSPYVTNGIELGLGPNEIPPGKNGTVRFEIIGITNVLYTDSGSDEYASAVFSPSWFDSDFVSGNTDLTVTYHLPPDISPDEPRWHEAPKGWPTEPITGFDSAGRITYTWRNSNANAYTQYLFGASFPISYVPASAVATPTFWENLGIDPEAILGWLCPCGFIAFLFSIPVLTIRSARRRKLKYLPPKLAIEGHGIKRGLTAIEASILLEQPMDKVLTMILFAVIKKGAAEVISRDPLKLKITEPAPQNLRGYETDFLAAMKEKGAAKRKKALQDAMIKLVKSVAKAMKGFSQRETKEYYKKITEAAWNQVEEADTPEVKSETYDKVMEWTMLDDEYDDRTRRVFRNYPVFVPTWWHRYDPRPTTSSAGRRVSAPTSRPTPGGTKMPQLPGSDFAASVVNGAQDFAGGIIGSVSGFTSGVTDKTNPIPKASSSSRSFGSGGSGGSSCACACACAGCACACAGGGR
jgi:hypothetical protein